MARKRNWYLALSYVKTQEDLDSFLEGVKNQDILENNKVVPNAVLRNRLTTLTLTNEDDSPLRNATAIQGRIDFALGKDENGIDRIPIVDKKKTLYEDYINEVISGNIKRTIEFLNHSNTLSRPTRLKLQFKEAVNASPRKKEFMDYILTNEEAKNSIIGKLFNLNSKSSTVAIKNINSISTDNAIGYLKYIMTSSDFNKKQRKQLFPRTSADKEFEPIKQNAKLIPVLSFLLDNNTFDREYSWSNKIPSNLKLQMGLGVLAENHAKKTSNATGVQKLYDNFVEKQDTSKGETDIGATSVATKVSRVGRLRNVNAFLKELDKKKNETEKTEFNNLLSTQKVPSSTILGDDWQLIADFINTTEGSRKALQNRLENEGPILAIKTVRDVNKILPPKSDQNDGAARQAFLNMTSHTGRTEGQWIVETSTNRRVTNKKELDSLNALFNKVDKDIKLLSSILGNNAFMDDVKKTKTMLTDNVYNLSKLELPDLIEFMIDVELYYHNDKYAEGNSDHILGDTTNPILEVSTIMEADSEGKLFSPLEVLLEKILKTCAEQYPKIRKSFINAIKEAMKMQSETKGNLNVIEWLEEKQLMGDE